MCRRAIRLHRRSLGLDQPLWLRYWHWFSRCCGGSGYSMLYNAPVAEVIGPALCRLLPAAGGGLAALRLFRDSAWALRRSLSQSLARSPYLPLCLPVYRLPPTFWSASAAGPVCGALAQLLPVCCARTPGLAADEADWLVRLRHLLLPVATFDPARAGQYRAAHPGGWPRCWRATLSATPRAQGMAAGPCCVFTCCATP